MKLFKSLVRDWKNIDLFTRALIIAIWVLEMITATMLSASGDAFLIKCGIVIYIVGTIAEFFLPSAAVIITNAVEKNREYINSLSDYEEVA